jgi:drug/metabolite transporter (DMT)-like permease
MPTKGSKAGTWPTSVWLGMLVLYVVWGSTYLGISIAVVTFPPFVMASIRFLIAGAVLFGWSILRAGRGFAWPTRREWRDSAIVGALLIGGGMGMVAWGEQTIPSGIAALLITTMPVWVAILGGVFLGERLPRPAIAGIVVGFAGVVILVGPSAYGGAGAMDPAGLLAIIISPLAWATGSLFASHRAVLPSRSLVSTGAQMLTGGLVLVVMGAVSGEWQTFQPAAISMDSFLAFAYLTVVGSLVAYTTYSWLLGVAPLPLISTYAYVNPIIAVILGWIVLQEPIDARTLVAGAVIVLAVALIVTSRGRLPRPAVRPEAVTPPPGSSASPVVRGP